MSKAFHSGFVAIVGRPNVGKSTLLNALVGEKVAIMSDKPQTTRNKITGVLTEGDYQIVFMDTPGMHRPKSKLGEWMIHEIKAALHDVDAVLMVVEADKKHSQIEAEMIQKLSESGVKVILLINKVDTIKKDDVLPIILDYSGLCDFHAVYIVSAKTGTNIEEVKKELSAILPEGPMYFPADSMTDQPERLLVAEVIREKALNLLDQEVPHGIAVEVNSMKKEEKSLVHIEATIFCEKNSHKGIIIGKNGAMLKKIGTLARKDMERIFGNRIYLNIWVKVKEDWRNSDFLLKDFGFKS